MRENSSLYYDKLPTYEESISIKKNQEEQSMKEISPDDVDKYDPKTYLVKGEAKRKYNLQEKEMKNIKHIIVVETFGSSPRKRIIKYMYFISDIEEYVAIHPRKDKKYIYKTTAKKLFNLTDDDVLDIGFIIDKRSSIHRYVLDVYNIFDYLIKNKGEEIAMNEAILKKCFVFDETQNFRPLNI
jgi:ABC-type antimicrobial peptide transport system permease subunit